MERTGWENAGPTLSRSATARVINQDWHEDQLLFEYAAKQTGVTFSAGNRWGKRSNGVRPAEKEVA